MTVSDSLIAFLRAWEGVRHRAYLDQAGLATIGVGHLLTDSDPPDWRARALTDEEVDDLLRHDLARFEDCVASAVTAPLEQHQFDACVSLAFNIGCNGFGRSSVRRNLNIGALGSVPASWRAWNKVTIAGQRRESHGLTRRREAELSIFTAADYSRRP